MKKAGLNSLLFYGVKNLSLKGSRALLFNAKMYSKSKNKLFSIENVDNIIENGIYNGLYTSASVIINIKNNVVFEKYYGLLNPKNHSSFTSSDSLYDIASITKIFVATACIKLCELGCLSLDQRISDYIQEFRNSLKEDITFRNILSHSSGLPASFNLYKNNEWEKGNDYIINKIINLELQYNPNEKVIYSCLGFMLLGYIMEKITNLRLDILLDKLLFYPYGFENIYYKPAHELHERIAITKTHRDLRGEISPGTVLDGKAIALHNGISGNAGLFTNAKTLTKFGTLFLSGEIISPLMKKEMISVQSKFEDEVRGLGWKLFCISSKNPGRCFSSKAFGHSGYNGGSIWIDPLKNLTICLLTNSAYFYEDKDDSKKFNEFRYLLHSEIVKNN